MANALSAWHRQQAAKVAAAHPLTRTADSFELPELLHITAQIKCGKRVIAEYSIPADHTFSAVDALMGRLEPGQYLNVFSACGPRFANVSCSQCGQEFGAGDHGFSHCDQHGVSHE